MLSTPTALRNLWFISSRHHRFRLSFSVHKTEDGTRSLQELGLLDFVCFLRMCRQRIVVTWMIQNRRHLHLFMVSSHSEFLWVSQRVRKPKWHMREQHRTASAVEQILPGNAAKQEFWQTYCIIIIIIIIIIVVVTISVCHFSLMLLFVTSSSILILKNNIQKKHVPNRCHFQSEGTSLQQVFSSQHAYVATSTNTFPKNH